MEMNCSLLSGPVYFTIHDSQQTDHELAKQLHKQNVGNCHTKHYVIQVTLNSKCSLTAIQWAGRTT
jgi:hypothetical protein